MPGGPSRPGTSYNAGLMSALSLRFPLHAAVCAAFLASVCACESRPVVVDGMLEWEDGGTPSNAGEAARNFITSKNPDWRRKAVGYLADEDFGGEPQYRRTYRTFGLTDADAGVRASAARALGEHGGPEDGAAIVPLLADKDPMVRLAAADALRKIELAGDAVAAGREGLIKLLADEDTDVRARAADALGHFPGERTMRALIDALEDSSFTVVWYAHRSLVACAGKGGKDFGLDAGLWAQWVGDLKGAEPASAYLWQPYYRRPSLIQWERPWSLFCWFEEPALEVPRTQAIREESSLKPGSGKESGAPEKEESLLKRLGYW